MGLFGPPNIEKMKAKYDVKGLIKALEYKGSNSDEIKRQAIVALGNFRIREAAEPLIAAIKTTPWEDQKAIVEALVNIGSSAVEPLIVALRDEHRQTRSRAAWALERLHDMRAVEPLIDALQKEKEENQRSWMIQALYQLGSNRRVEPLIDAFRKETGENNRGSLIYYLGEMKDKRAVEPLMDALGNEKNEEKRGSIITALANLEDTRAVEPLIELLKNESNEEIRGKVISALGILGDKRAIDALTSALKDPSDKNQALAVQALGKFGAGAVKPLTGILDSKTAYKKLGEDALDVLIAIGAPACESLMDFAMKNKDDKKRIELLTSRLLNAIKRGAGSRSEIVEILGRIGDPAVEELVNRFQYCPAYESSRRNLADALVELYQRGELSAAAKKKILSQREAITEKHVDYTNDYIKSCETEPGHTDTGLGIEFPI